MMSACQTWQSTPWLVHYGRQITPELLRERGIDIAFVDPDAVNPADLRTANTRLIAYVSVGEADPNRAHCQHIADRPYVIEKNPIWGSYLVDIRDPEWQNLLIRELMPAIIQKGFDGFLLDTVDVAALIEHRDPVKYKGAGRALVDFVRAVRAEFPDALIIPNNGFEFLSQYGDMIDGVMVEDLYTRYDFERKKSIETPPSDRALKEGYLDAFVAQFGKPVYNLLYESSPKTPLARAAIRHSLHKHYHWYLTTVDLMNIGTFAR